MIAAAVQPAVRRPGIYDPSLPGRMGAAMWIDASAPPAPRFRAASGGGRFVALAGDSTLNRNHALQTTDARQPRFRSDGINGLPAFDFEIEDTQFLTVAAASGIDNLFDGGGYIATVIQTESTADSTQFICRKSGVIYLAAQDGSRIEFLAAMSTQSGKWRTPNSSFVDGMPTLIECNWTGLTADTPVILINGVEQTLTVVSAPIGDPVDDSAFPLSIAGNGSTGAYDGMIGAIGAFGFVPSADSRRQFSRMLRRRWKL